MAVEEVVVRCLDQAVATALSAGALRMVATVWEGLALKVGHLLCLPCQATHLARAPWLLRSVQLRMVRVLLHRFHAYWLFYCPCKNRSKSLASIYLYPIDAIKKSAVVKKISTMISFYFSVSALYVYVYEMCL